MGVQNVRMFGNQLVATQSDGSRTTLTSSGSGIFRPTATTNIAFIKVIGNHILDINYNSGSHQIATRSGSKFWYADPTFDGGGESVGILVDTISPGHHITNPGGTITSGWSWHITNEGNRGGDDWNYSYGTPFTAPADGIVSHYDVSGVGMVVELVLDTPVNRINPQQIAGYDQFGPIATVHFEHCSAAFDGHHSQGDIIGHSGDGYGAYPAHLHVHGQTTDVGGPGSSANRCCFWGFV